MRQSIFATAAGTEAARERRSSRRPRILARAFAMLTAATLLGVTAGGAAVADELWNGIDGPTPGQNTLDGAPEVVPLVIGATKTVTFRLQARTGEGDPSGCNVGSGRTATFAFRSSNPDVATVTTPSTGNLTFTTCSTAVNGYVGQDITVQAKGAGTTTFTASVVSSTTGAGSFDVLPAQFRIDVAPPPNNAPTMEVFGLDKLEFPKGTQPTATCRVTDVEEGVKEFAASLVKKVAGGDGLGAWIARCFYQDAQGAIALATPEYTVIDPTPVVVRYFVNTREGDQPWIRSDVRLHWVVEDPESPNHITKAPDTCIDQNVLTDGKQEFVCEAVSYNGQPKRIVATVLRDASGPKVEPTVTSTPIVVNGVTWYKGSATIDWTTSDAHSGVADGTLRSTVPAPLVGRTTTVGQGRAQLARVVANDVAGNVGEGVVRDINVDAGAPTVTTTVASTPAYQGWFKDSATVTVTASDPEVSPLERGSGVAADANPSGPQTVTQSGEFTVSATDNVGNVGWSEPRNLLIDGAAPTAKATCPSDPIIKGTAKTAAWTATDEGSGVAGDSSGTVSLDTSSIGSKLSPAKTVTDNVGHDSSAATCGYKVVYDYKGFFAPVDNNGVLNQVKAGSAVPVKFSLGGNEGLSVLDGTPIATKLTCTTGLPTDALEETVVASNSGLKYDALANQYNYVWKTTSTMANTCQKLTVKLADGTTQTALFKLVK